MRRCVAHKGPSGAFVTYCNISCFFFFFFFFENFFFSQNAYTVELQWPEHLWNHEKMFEIVVVRANEC